MGEPTETASVGPDKRGNPPFEPSSYAAGLERRVKRHARWADRAKAAAKWLLDGTPSQKEFAEKWWRENFDQPNVVASDPSPNPESYLHHG